MPNSASSTLLNHVLKAFHGLSPRRIARTAEMVAQITTPSAINAKMPIIRSFMVTTSETRQRDSLCFVPSPWQLHAVLVRPGRRSIVLTAKGPQSCGGRRRIHSRLYASLANRSDLSKADTAPRRFSAPKTMAAVPGTAPAPVKSSAVPPISLMVPEAASRPPFAALSIAVISFVGLNWPG